MQSNFDACVAFTLAAEGGYVEDIRDSGGATNMGITLRTLRNWRGDQLLSPRDVKALTKDEAEAIYGAAFWNPVRGDDLPVGLDLVTFDFGVNAGPRRSAMELQQALGVAADGWIGSVTLGACNANDPAALITALTLAHEAYYRALPTYRTFGRGWTNRAERAKAAALRMLAA